MDDSEDHISHLSIDCIVDVLARVDHLDLDEIATLSVRMADISEMSRSRAVKLVAENMIVSQETKNQLSIYVNYNNNNICVTPANSKYGMLRKRSSDQQSFIERSLSLFRRFDFNGCSFTGIIVDEPLLAFIERVTSSHSFDYFELTKSGFDRNLSKHRRESFANMLISLKLSKVHLTFNYNVPLFDKSFIERFAQNVHAPSFTLEQVIDKGSMIRVDEDFAECLPQFKTLKMLRLVFNNDLLIPVLLSRRDLKLEGEWKFYVTRNFLPTEIQAIMGSDVSSSSSNDFLGNENNFWSNRDKSNNGKVRVMQTERYGNDPEFWTLQVWFETRIFP